MTAVQLLNALFNTGIAVSVGATVLSLGMIHNVGQLIAPLRRITPVVPVVVLNVAVIPAIAWLVTEALPVDDAHVAGLVLVTLGAGGAAALKAAQLAARTDLPLAVSLVVVLQLINIVAVPLWASRIVGGTTLSAWDIVQGLLILVLAPLVVGLLVRARYGERVRAWTRGLTRVANLALAVALVAGIVVNWSTLLAMFGTWVPLASVVIIAVSALLGAVVGGRDVRTRITTGLVSGLRLSSIGLIIIGTQLDSRPDYLGPAITFALLDFVLLLATAIAVGRRAGAPTNPAAM